MLIVATISKNSYTADKIEEIVRSGADVLRFNFSHGSPDEMAAKVKVAHEVIERCGYLGRVKILADLPGDKLRLGKYSNYATEEFPVVKGQQVRFVVGSEGDPAVGVPVDVTSFRGLVSVGDIICVGDGEVALRAIEVIDTNSFIAEALNDRYLPAMKAIHIGAAIDQRNHLTTQTRAHIAQLAAIRPDWVAFSFVNSAAYVDEARLLLNQNVVDGWHPQLMVKLESPAAMRNLSDIISRSDSVMVARGDLAITHPFEIVGLLQKKIIKEAQRQHKPVIVATQILDSILSYYTPQRAEVLDLTQIVLDGADGIVLAKETGISPTPGYSVAVARRIIDVVESGQYLL